MAKIKLNISHMGVAPAIPYLEKIGAKMAGSTKFTSLATDTAALVTATSGLDTANTNYEKSKSDTDQMMTLRDNAFAAASDAAHALANGAQKITTDASDLQGGGWDLVSDRSPVGPMSAPANFSATSGDNAGEVDLACDTQQGVQTHTGETATSADGPFTQFYVGRKSSCTAAGLVSGSLNWFRMRAVGAAGPGPYAGPISKRAT